MFWRKTGPNFFDPVLNQWCANYTACLIGSPCFTGPVNQTFCRNSQSQLANNFTELYILRICGGTIICPHGSQITVSPNDFCP